MKGFFKVNDEVYPEAPDMGTAVKKLRAKANALGGVMQMSREERHAYADAVEERIRAVHRTLHMRPTPPMTPGWYNPPSVARLLKWNKPVKMVGDPDWVPECRCERFAVCTCDHWAPREKAVYAATMEAKRAAQCRP